MDIRSFFGAGAGKSKTQDSTKPKTGRPKNGSNKSPKNPYKVKPVGDSKSDKKPVVVDSDSDCDDVVKDSQDEPQERRTSRGKRTSLKTYGNDKTDSGKSFSEIINADSDFEIESVHSSDGEEGKKSKTKIKAKAKAPKEKKTSSSKKKPKKRNISSDEESDFEILPEEILPNKSIDVESSDEEDIISIRRKGAKKGKKGAKKSQSHKLFESDSEEDPIPKDKPKRKKKEPVYNSDEERQQKAMDRFLTGGATSSSKKKETKPEPSTKGKPTSVADFFGTASTKRVERPVAVTKRKLEETLPIELESEMHDDEDFLLTLDQLDGPLAKKIKPSELTQEDLEFLNNSSSDKVQDISNMDEGKTVLSPMKVKAKQEMISLSPVKEKIMKDNKSTLEESSSKEKTPSKKKETPASKIANKIKALKDMMNKNDEIVKELDKKSPVKAKVTKGPSPAKKKGKVYSMEVTRNAPSVTSPGKAKVKAKEDLTPPKKVAVDKPLKDDGDDGFGRKSTSGFGAFKARGGPLALGSKELPEGAENCLEGLTFVITGVLDSIERDDCKGLIERHGGKVTGSISKKTGYVVVGREPGESKIKKATELKVKQLDEDELFELIKTKPGKQSKYELQAIETMKKEESIKKAEAKSDSAAKKLESYSAKKPYTKGMFKADDKETEINEKKLESYKTQFTQMKKADSSQKSDTDSPLLGGGAASSATPDSLLWVDKHKPTSLRSIIGQQGDKSNARKLLNWMRDWHTNIVVKGLKSGGGNYFGGAGDGKGCRAALLSGPPGIGKTTTATLVCKELGFSFVELNASDTRSKKNLKECVSESLNNTTLVDFMGSSEGHHQGDGHHHCIIMDEVDGMAGNEDRGGLQELVQLIKSSKIPVICICNDRNHMKMRTLANYCLDLRFSRPRIEQIKGAMMTLAFKEGIKIPSPALNEIIQASNHDIRQVIHNLSMWSAGDKNMTFDQVKTDSKKAQKDFKLGPFDVCRKVFVDDEETRKMTINDKSDLFFNDYSFGPLFVHENYPHIIPKRAGGSQAKHMSCLSRCIDSLSDGDLLDRYIRKEQNWGLLPMQAMMSSVIPGEVMRGSFPQMTAFPQWLGKFSSTNKTERILGELGTHMRLEISSDKRGLTLDYLPALKTKLTGPLTSEGSEGVPEVIQTMDDYDIIREDFDNILEVTKWTGRVDVMKALDPKTKAFFTRQYNKQIHTTPYSSGVQGTKKRKARGAPMDDDMFGGEEGEAQGGEESEEDEEKLEKAEVEAMKAKKRPAQIKAKAAASKAKAKPKPAKAKAPAPKAKLQPKPAPAPAPAKPIPAAALKPEHIPTKPAPKSVDKTDYRMVAGEPSYRKSDMKDKVFPKSTWAPNRC